MTTICTMQGGVQMPSLVPVGFRILMNFQQCSNMARSQKAAEDNIFVIIIVGLSLSSSFFFSIFLSS